MADDRTDCDCPICNLLTDSDEVDRIRLADGLDAVECDEQAPEPIKCHFCEATVADVDAAVEADWAPSFYAAGDEYETPEPVCPVCWGKYLEVDESGELVQVTE